MAKPDDLIRIAQAEVGATDGRKYWDWYWHDTWEYVDGYTTPYCACFVSWCLDQAGVKCDDFPSAVAFDWRDGGNIVGHDELRAGDPVAFDWDGDLGGDHVGICTGVYDWGITTVEGNTSGGRVLECQRPWGVVICGVRPYYDEEEEDMSDELMERLADMVATLAAQRSAEYVYGDEDKGRDLNMYNAAHWAYNIGLENRTRLDRVEAKMDAIMRHLRIEQ